MLSAAVTCLTARPEQGIEEQRESRVRLRAMLRAQTEQHDAARLHINRHDRRAPRHQFIPFQPARSEHARVRVTRDYRRAMRIEAFNQRIERAVVIETVSARGHAEAYRMRLVNFDLQNTAGREVLIARQAAFEIANGE